MLKLHLFISLLIYRARAELVFWREANPRNLTAVVLGPTSVNLSWKPPQIEINGTIIYAVKKNGMDMPNTTDTDYLLSDLLPSTMYNISVFGLINETDWILPGMHTTVTTFEPSPNKAFSVCHRFWLSLSTVVFSYALFVI
nr:unnamed protein product [Spirometra erinaceieuropaei]